MKTRLLPLFAATALALALPLSAAAPIQGLPEPLPPPALDDPGVQVAPADQFFATLAEHCGQAFAGRIVADTPASADDPFAGKALVMHLHDCSADAIRIGFHAGDDRSRTWVLTRTAAGLRLQHDHRHADGSADPLTMYGGDSRAGGSAGRQEFPADAASKALFADAGRAASQANVWALEIEPGLRFRYELARPDSRLFQVDFDLRAAQLPPPPPWGTPAR